MNTSVYITPDEILSIAMAMAGDTEGKVIPPGFYNGLIQSAFEGLAIATFFQELRWEGDFPEHGLTIPLPKGCFNVQNVYVYSGTNCVIEKSHKLYWKRNYYTQGTGYIANNKVNNPGDPFLPNHNHNRGPNIPAHSRTNDHRVDRVLFYNIQMGNMMFSSSCKQAGNKIHIHYNGTGCEIGDAPIIPVFLREAIQHYVIEGALLFRMANDPVNARAWQSLQQIYERKLDKDGFNGSWHQAKMNVQKLNSSQRNELSEYLSKGAWGTGY